MGRPRPVRGYLGDTLVVAALGASVLFLLGTGCVDRVVSPGNDGRNVTVTEGGDALLATGERLHFVHVDTDSRCPKGLECFWEGEASAAFSVGASAKVATPFSLEIFGALVAADTALSMQRFQPVTVGRYHLTLLQLDPYPR